MASIVINGDTSGSVTLQAPASAGATVLTLPSTSGTILTTASGQWITSGSDIYYNTGNVGIGTASPVYKLEVSGAIGAIFANPDVSGIVIQATTGTNAAAMKFNNTGGNFFVGKDSSSGARISGTAYANCVWGETAYPTIFGTNNIERMRIDSSGNVGIGTSTVLSPVQSGFKLQVNGAINALCGYSTYTADGLYGATATPIRFSTPNNGPTATSLGGGVLIGYSDNGSGGYSPAIGLYQTFNAISAPFTTTSQSSIGLVANGSMVFSNGTSNTERMRIDSSGYVTNQANGNSAGLVQGYQYYRLNSAVAGANATGAQNIFGVGVTLVGSTVYEFEIAFALSKSAGTTSHNITLSFGGTATLNNIGFFISGQGGAGIANSVGSFGSGNINGIGFANSSSIQVVTACVTAANGLPYLLKGTVSVNAGGTFIPQYTLSAAPGGAYTTQIGSYIKIAPLSASGSNTSIGAWA